MFLLVAASTAGAQDLGDTAKVRLDTTFLARDLNGNGARDHVVREKRPFVLTVTDSGDSLYLYVSRVAIYLDAPPDEKRAPNWASSWDEDLGGPSRVDTTIAVPGGHLMQIAINDADAVTLIVLHIRDALVTPAIVKQIDYGEGALEYRASGDTVVALVTSPATMDGQGYSLDATGRCDPKKEWPAMRFAFDHGSRRFRRTTGFECLRRYYLDTPDQVSNESSRAVQAPAQDVRTAARWIDGGRPRQPADTCREDGRMARRPPRGHG